MQLVVHPFQRKLWGFLKKSRLYGFSLMGNKIKKIPYIPRDLWKGNGHFGHNIMAGTLRLENKVYTLSDIVETLKLPMDEDDPFVFYLHSFTFLQDIAALNANIARKYIRNTIELWIRAQHSFAAKSWNKIAWQPGLVGLRLCVSLQLYDFFASTADEQFKSLFLKSFEKQLKYLLRHWGDESNPLSLLWAIKGILLCQEFGIIHLDPSVLLKSLVKSVDAQILPDGGHVSRSALLHWRYLRDLIDLRCSLQNILQSELKKYTKQPTQDTLDLENLLLLDNKLPIKVLLVQKTLKHIHECIQKMTPILRLMRHVDGTIARFEGGMNAQELGVCAHVTAEAIDSVLSVTDTHSTRPPQRATSFGYERCANRSSILMVNTYPSVMSSNKERVVIEKQKEIPINVLNFEWSVGRHRFIENADLIVHNPNKKWVYNLAPSGLTLKLKRHARDGFHYLSFDCVYHKNDLVFFWKRELYLSPKGETLQGIDSFKMPSACTLGIRFRLNSSFKVMSEGGKFFIGLPVDGPIKKDLPLTTNSFETMEDFQTLYVSPPKPIQNTLLGSKKPLNDYAWLFRSQGGDETLLSDANEEERIIMLMKACEADYMHSFKWSFSQSQYGE